MFIVKMKQVIKYGGVNGEQFLSIKYKEPGHLGGSIGCVQLLILAVRCKKYLKSREERSRALAGILRFIEPQEILSDPR